LLTDNTVLEQANTFTYLGCRISYEDEKERDLENKLFLKLWEFREMF